MATKPKTWAVLMDEITATFHKWRDSIGDWSISNDLAPRSRAKRTQTKEERTVRLRFFHYNANTRVRREIVMTMSREETATANLAKIAVALETLRLAEVRQVEAILVLLYRQMDPIPQVHVPPPRPTEPRQVPQHYAVLHVSPDAPLVVCEAAYRALARTAHPDAGGSEETMKALNLAIEQVRAEKG
jgi:hypothetical protein